MKCDKCNMPAKLLKNSTPVYGRDYGPVWVCGNFPLCDARCGCHKGTHNPLGTLADAETRRLREQCHAAFDPLWRRGAMTRKEAYGRLAKAMLISIRDCHFGMFNKLRCQAALDCIKRIKWELEVAGA